MGHLGVVLYEYLGEEYPEVLGSILGALKAIVNVIGMTRMTPPIKDLLPRLTPILKNRYAVVSLTAWCSQYCSHLSRHIYSGSDLSCLQSPPKLVIQLSSRQCGLPPGVEPCHRGLSLYVVETTENKMTVNLLKTVEIVFHRPNVSHDLFPCAMPNVSRVLVAKLLGVHLRHDLNNTPSRLLPLVTKDCICWHNLKSKAQAYLPLTPCLKPSSSIEFCMLSQSIWGI